MRRLAIELYAWLQLLIVALVTVLLIFLFVAKVVIVEGNSMLPTLQNGAVILTTTPIGYTPKQGDIVILQNQAVSEKLIAKRIIALGGQWVDIDFVRGEVWVDHQRLHEDYIKAPTHLFYDVTFPLKVADGCVFVLGDNRNASTDSRSSLVGMVDVRSILGKVQTVLFPIDDFGGVYA